MPGFGGGGLEQALMQCAQGAWTTAGKMCLCGAELFRGELSIGKCIQYGGRKMIGHD
jgi:hypothetical protein